MSPGTYEFRLLNSNSADHNVVLIFNLNAQLVAMVPTVLTQYWAPDLNDLINHTMLTFAVSSNNQPLTLVSWFYPGQNFGHQMVYSKRIERQLSGHSFFRRPSSNTPLMPSEPPAVAINLKTTFRSWSSPAEKYKHPLGARPAIELMRRRLFVASKEDRNGRRNSILPRKVVLV